jgi:hypothetical protein
MHPTLYRRSNFSNFNLKENHFSSFNEIGKRLQSYFKHLMENYDENEFQEIKIFVFHEIESFFNKKKLPNCS